MGKIVITEFVSLDGIAEDPGGSENFEHGGWAFATSRGDEGDQFKNDELDNSDALLLGRVTYEGFADAWPGREGEFADKFNGMPKHVVSTTLTDPQWTNTSVVEGDLAAAVEQLKAQYDNDIVVHGSLQLAQSLLDAGLVDELRLMVYPVVLGSGKPLFAPTASQKPLTLTGTKAVGDGVVILTYTPAA